MTTPAQAGHVPLPTTSPVPDDTDHAASLVDRAVAGIMGTVPDVTGPSSGEALDRAENPLLDERLWQIVFEHAPTPLSLVSASGRQLAGNAAYRAYLGYSADELSRLDVAQLTRDEDQAWTQAYLARLVAGDLDRYTTEKVYVRKDGTESRARLDITPIRQDGRCIGLLGALTPIVERRPMGEGLLRKLIENIHDTISLVDAEGRLLETTGRYRPIMGYPSEFWETRSIFDLLVPEDVERVIALRDEVIDRPGETVSAEFSVLSAHNTVEVLEVHAVNLLDDPDIAGIVITSRNITEHRTLVEELRTSRDDAMAEAELRSRMLATVSHELRNPLHAVQGISELLAQSVLPEAERAMAGTINRQVRDLTRVVDDLLTSSRLELDAVPLEPEAVDLRGLLTDVVAIARTVANPGVDVHAFIDASIPSAVRTDPVRLRQVLSNLVGNAVKFTAAGRVRVLACVERDEVLVLEVSDSGSGIPAGELEAVFEPFRSASTAGPGAGAGLGLSIVRRIVSMLGGNVGVTSTVGVGSTFRIELPLETVEVTTSVEPGVAPASVPAAPVPAAPVPAASVPAEAPVPAASPVVAASPVLAGPAASGPAVLVVEDNTVNQQLARAQLKSMGYECVIVGSGEEGLAHLASPAGAAIDVVLMDYHLPGIDGLETTRRIRAAETGRHVAIIGVTASASLADRESCIAAGMDDYVPKPVSLGDLSAAFERVAPIRLAAQTAATTAASISRPSGPDPSAPGGSAGDEVTIDVSALAGLADELGDRTTVVDLVATFLDELDGRLDAIVAARAAGDGPLLRRLVHTITSSARLLGAGELAQRCAAFEDRHLDEHSLRSAGRAVRRQLEAWSA
jgi:PAS domain S-box-containing protein